MQIKKNELVDKSGIAVFINKTDINKKVAT